MGFPLPQSGFTNLFPDYIDVATYANIGTYIAIGASPATSGEVRLTAGTINAPTTLSLEIAGVTTLQSSASLLTAYQPFAFNLSGTPASTGTVRFASGDSVTWDNGSGTLRTLAYCSANSLIVGADAGLANAAANVYLVGTTAVYIERGPGVQMAKYSATGIEFDCQAGGIYSLANIPIDTTAPTGTVHYVTMNIDGVDMKVLAQELV